CRSATSPRLSSPSAPFPLGSRPATCSARPPRRSANGSRNLPTKPRSKVMNFDKNSKRSIPVFFAPVILALASPMATGAEVNRLIFDQALTLSSASIALQAERVELKLNKKANAWKEDKVRRSIQRCAVDLKIEGRDLAPSNVILGEHYFGSMSLN